ncbi:hypothetical protein TcCL_NonESM12916, partial [Trypanosoma cruzi]
PTSVIGFGFKKKRDFHQQKLSNRRYAQQPILYFAVRFPFFSHLHSAANLHLPWDAIQGPTTKRRALLDALLAAQAPWVPSLLPWQRHPPRMSSTQTIQKIWAKY